MALDPKREEEIRGYSEDIAKNYAAIEKSLAEANEEQKDFLDLAKQIAVSKKAIEDSRKNEEDATKRLNGLVQEIARAESIRAASAAQMPRLHAASLTEMDKLRTLQSEYTLSAEKEATTAADLARIAGDIEKQQTKVANITKLIAFYKENDKKYSEEALSAMRAQKMDLEIIKDKSANINLEQKSILESLVQQQGINKSLLKPLIGDSKEANKLWDMGQAILKEGQTAYLALIEASLERWIELDKAAGEFRKTTGLLTTQTLAIDKAVREINVDMQQFGVSLADGYRIATELYKNFQTTALVTKDLIADTAKMEANLGIAAADTAKFATMFGAASMSATGTATGLAKAAAALAEMGGVAPTEVMHDMANASARTLTFLGRSPMQLMRASVEARRLGTTIEKISESARGMLDYQSSINSELEASALLGRSVSFQESRLLAFQGKVVESRKAALNEIKKAGDFTKLNVYQQEALAKAAGMTVDEVLKQQNQEKMLNAIKTKGTAEQKAQLAKYESMQKQIAENEKAAQKDLVARGEEMLKQQLRQAEMNKLTNALTSIWVDITDALLPIANAIMPVIIMATRLIGGTFKLIATVVRGLLKPFDSLLAGFRSGEEGGKKLEKAMTGISTLVQKMIPYVEDFAALFGYTGYLLQKMAIGTGLVLMALNKFTGWGVTFKNVFSVAAKAFDVIIQMGSRLGGIFKPFSFLFKGLGFISKFLGPIGVVINAFQFVLDLVGQLTDIWSSDKMDVGEKILRSLVAVPKAIWNTLVQPIINAVAWVLDKIVPGLGGGMLKGISSIGEAIFDVLKWPFREFLGWFSDDSGLSGHSPSEIGLNIVKGLASVGGMVFDFLVSPFKKAWELVKKLPFVGKLFGGAKDAAATVSSEVQSSVETQTSTLVEIKNLDEMKTAITQLTEATNRLVNAATANFGTAGIAKTAGGNNSGVEAKLDELIGLLRAGAIAVNMDGKKVSAAVATMGT